jgi:VWFA-related protein
LRNFASLLFALALATGPLPAAAQTTPAAPPPGSQQEEVVRVGASEVVLDMVVRDKKGRLVRDLKPSDVEVYEDGARQDLSSFQLVSHEPGEAGTAAGQGAIVSTPAPGVGAASPNRGVEPVSAVALVFDRLSPESRVLARQAAGAYLDAGLSSRDYIGVFGIDLSLRVFQTFTHDEQAVRRAIEGAGSQTGSPNASRLDRINESTQKAARLQSQIDQARSSAGAGTALPDASTMYDSVFAQMTKRSEETFEMLERNQEGDATMHSLLAVIDSLGQLPGRKLIVFFSEGLAIPPAVEGVFRSVISNANRAGVSVYSVDAAGLRTQSADQVAGRALTTLGQQRISVANSPDEPGRPMMRDMERNEDLMRFNPESGLGQLSNQTGGFLVSHTNNPGPRLRAAAEDLHTYYAVAYTPKNQNYDGRFREIAVKVNRPGVEVQTRKGYFAVRNEYDSPVLDYEAPALALLSGSTAAASGADPIPLRAGGFNFPEAARPGRSPVVVEVPAGAVTYSTDPNKKMYHSDFSVVALVRDESQRPVKKLSNHYLLSGPIDKLDAAKRGSVLFYREADLAPGRYTIAAAVYDKTTGRAGTAVSGALVVPAADETKPRVASVVIIDRAERAASAQATDNPFRFGELFVYPNLGAPLHKSSVKELALMLTVYAARGERTAPKLTLEIARGGRTLAKAPLELPTPDDSGRIQYASTIPTEKLPPGDYQLTITAADARGSASRTARFTIQDK